MASVFSCKKCVVKFLKLKIFSYLSDVVFCKIRINVFAAFFTAFSILLPEAGVVIMPFCQLRRSESVATILAFAETPDAPP